MKRLIIAALLLLNGLVAADAQTKEAQKSPSTIYLERFNKFIRQNDTIFAKSVLTDWTEEIPNDPELYVAWFSYYYNTGVRENAILSKRPSQNPNDSNMEMKDSTGNVTGYIVTCRTFNPDKGALAVESISKGIENYPERLDMRILKVLMLGNLNQWDLFSNNIKDLYNQIIERRYSWKMSGGQVYPEVESYLLQAMEEWMNMLFRMDADGANMRKIAEAMLAHNAKNVTANNFMGISFLKEKQYAKALQWFKKADKASSQNPMVLRNMALCYKLLNDRKNFASYDAKAKAAEAKFQQQ